MDARFRVLPVFFLVTVVASSLLIDAAWAQVPSRDGFVPVTDAILQEPDPDDWINWRRTLDGWGYSPLTQINTDNVHELQLVWAWQLDTGVSRPTPLVYDGLMFIPSPGNSVHALDAATGRSYWRSQQLDSAVRGSPALDNDTAFIATDGGSLYALDAINGNQIWGFQVDASNADRLLADPIARDGLVYITAMNGERLVMAYHQDSGQMAWQFQPDG